MLSSTGTLQIRSDDSGGHPRLGLEPPTGRVQIGSDAGESLVINYDDVVVNA